MAQKADEVPAAKPALHAIASVHVIANAIVVTELPKDAADEAMEPVRRDNRVPSGCSTLSMKTTTIS